MFRNSNTYRRAIWAVVIVAAMAIGTSVAGQGKVGKRTIGEFLNAQGTTTMFFPFPDEFGWADNPMTTFAWFDYAAKTPNMGTTTSGTVTERLMSDGRVEVRVILHTTHALAWAAEDWQQTSPTWFGYRPDLLQTGDTPAFGDCQLQAVFFNPAPRFPLPDLVRLVSDPDYVPPPGQEMVSLFFRGTATGPLRAAFGVPEGTPGVLTVSQTGFFHKKGNPLPSGDGWPAEIVELTVAP